MCFDCHRNFNNIKMAQR
ncbi:hypothetical protein Goari_006754 [Gossypium aridum]|nr:hypothetical protein [Gossypium aridum]